MTKKYALVFSGVLSLVALLATEELRFCYFIGLKECIIALDDSQEMLFLPFLPFFFFSLSTYFMKEEIFQVWWRFARWFVPVIIVATLFLNGGGGGLGISGAASGAFNFLVLCILYFTFILVSSIKIIRAHKRLKRQEESVPGFQPEPQMTLGEGILSILREKKK